MAREAAKPGSVSRRTLDFLGTLEKEEAHLFTSVCRYTVNDGHKDQLAIFLGDAIAAIYSQSGISYEALGHLSTIGLVEFTTPFLTPFFRCYETQELLVSYFGEVRKFHVFEMNPREKSTALIMETRVSLR